MLTIDRAALCTQLRKCGVGDDAEDLVQDLMLKAARLEGDPSIADPGAYLCRMALNMARDHMRAVRRRINREEVWSGIVYGGGIKDETPLPDRRIAARQSLRDVAALLSSLDARSRSIFQRFRIDGVSQAQIAKEEGISISGVQKRLGRVYRRLKALGRGEHEMLPQAASE